MTKQKGKHMKNQKNYAELTAHARDCRSFGTLSWEKATSRPRRLSKLLGIACSAVVAVQVLAGTAIAQQLSYRWQRPDGTWSDEQKIGGLPSGDPIAVPPPDYPKVSGIFRQAKRGRNVKTAVLVPDTTFFAPNGTIATMGNNGYTLVDVDIDTSTGQRLYSAVFESGVPYTQYFELVPSDFQNKVTALDGQGIRLISLHTYVSTSGTLFYSGVFQQGPDPQRYPGDLSWNDFTHLIDTWAPSGYFLTNLAVFVIFGQERYLGVWRYRPESTSRSAFWVSGWNSFAKQDQWENALGFRLVSMAHWEFNGDRKYGGVWLEGNDAYDVVAATDASVYTRKASELAAANPSRVPIRITTEHGYQPPVGLAAAFNDEFDSVAVGYSYAISEAGTLTAKGAFGYARAPWEPPFNVVSGPGFIANYPNSPMSQTTRMDIASVTKAVTATAIFKLLEGSSRTCVSGTCNASNFALDTPIASILTGSSLGQYVSQVTVRMLVNMTSNLYEGSCNETYGNDANSYVACVLASCTKAWLPAAGGIPKQPASGGCSPPSGQYNYNGTDPGVLKVVIEKLTGMTFEQYVQTALFVPSGINSPSLDATDMGNANCNPDLSPSNMQPLYYHSGASKTYDTGIPEVNDRPRSLAVCGAGAMQAAVWQLDLFTRALMTGIEGGSPLLTTDDRSTMLSAGMFGGPYAYPGLGHIFAKNGGFPMRDDKGMVSAIVMAPDINTQLAAIVNTQGTDRSTNLGPNPPAALIDGLVRMHSTPLGVFSVRNRNNTNFGDMCLNVAGAALADLNPDGTNVDIIQWTCGSPVADNMLFVQLDVGGGYFMLQSVNSGHCINVSGGSTSDNANIIQWGCDGSSNELFSFSPTSGGYGHIISKNSGKCLDVSGGSIYSGANIIQNTCSSSQEQDFKLQARR
jgi:CubicO group peptidase (beta-lactamase class C family)